MNFVKYAESQRARVKPHKEVVVWGTRPFQNWEKVIQKMKAHASIEAELLARKENQSHIIYNVLGITREARTKMLSSYFFAVLISYANSTFLTRQTSISSSTLLLLVLDKI